MNTLISDNSESCGEKKQQCFKDVTKSAHLACQEATLLSLNRSLQAHHLIFSMLNQNSSDVGDQIQFIEKQIDLLKKPSLPNSEKVRKIQHLLTQLEFIYAQFNYPR